jgi:Uma2 family endonuclease
MSSIVTPPLPGTTIDPRYPDSDGRFMGETDFHNVAMVWLKEALQDFFANRDDVYVASNLIMYFQEGDAKKRRDPDVLVATGVGKHMRRAFRVWEEKTLPRVLFEIASRRTWRKDIGEKRELYAQLRIPEYFIFDPEGCYLHPVVQGFRSEDGQSVPMEADADGGLISAELGLRLVTEGTMLRLIDLRTGRPVPTRSEQAEQSRTQAELAQERVHKLQAEVERLRAQLGRNGPRP